MAEAPQTPPTDAAGDQSQQQARLMIQTQYIKDLSFENPRAPQSFESGQTRPEITVRIDVRAQPVGSDRHEVALHLSVEAKVGEDTAFVCELTYAGLFALMNIPEQSLQPVLMIECPRLLFPFARRVVADATRDGGFPPLMIDPVDFAALYRRRLQQQQQAEGGDGAPSVENPTVS